jgi:hypothetical protein
MVSPRPDRLRSSTSSPQGGWLACVRASHRLLVTDLPPWAGLLVAGCEALAAAALVVLTVRGAAPATATTALGSLVLGAGLPLAALQARRARVERWQRLTGRATGTVVGLLATKAAIVSWPVSGRREQRLQAMAAGPGLELGEPVTVMYEPGSPDAAEVERPLEPVSLAERAALLSSAPLVLCGLGALLLVRQAG